MYNGSYLGECAANLGSDGEGGEGKGADGEVAENEWTDEKIADGEGRDSEGVEATFIMILGYKSGNKTWAFAENRR